MSTYCCLSEATKSWPVPAGQESGMGLGVPDAARVMEIDEAMIVVVGVGVVTSLGPELWPWTAPARVATINIDPQSQLLVVEIIAAKQMLAGLDFK